MSAFEQLLVWVLVAACAVTGFKDYSPLMIAPLAVAAMVVFFTIKPRTLSFGLKERGISYLFVMFIGSSAIVAIPFFLGRVAGIWVG